MNFNPAHIHLLVNHIPVFTSIFAALLILWGMLRKSEEVLRAGLLVAIVAGLSVFGVKLTGEPAEHTVVGITGVDKRLIDAHEEAADWAVIMIGAAGALGLVTLLLMRRRGAARLLALLTAVVELVGFAAVVRTANLGGEIRHPEIRPGFVPPPPPPRAAGGPAEDRD